jgi:hypothetical protein
MGSSRCYLLYIVIWNIYVEMVDLITVKVDSNRVVQLLQSKGKVVAVLN